MSNELSKLTPPPGANKAPKIVGRGIGSGHGKQSTRGGKGQKARKSGPIGRGFEGGQMPMQRRLPKRGFSNYPFTKEFAEVRLSDLNKFEANSFVDRDAMRKIGLAKGRHDGVKILANGEISIPLKVKVHRISKSAKEKIEQAGGSVELIADRPKWKREDKRAKRRASKGK